MQILKNYLLEVMHILNGEMQGAEEGPVLLQRNCLALLELGGQSAVSAAW